MSQVKQTLERMEGQVDTAMKGLRDQVDDRFNKLKSRMDTIEKENGRIDGGTPNDSQFKDALTKELKAQKSDIRALRDGKTAGFSMNIKASIGGRLRDSDPIPGVAFQPDETPIRSILPQISTTGNSVPFAIENTGGWTDGVQGQTESEIKGESDFTITEETADVQTRATFLKIPKQMLDDVNYLSSYVSRRLRGKMFVDENDQLLRGNGTSPNILGLIPQSQTATSTSTVFFDILADGINQIRTEEYAANFALVHPNDLNAVILEKGDDGHYLHDSGIRSGNQPLVINGVRVMPTTAMNENEYLIGDSSGATMALREGINIRWFEQDSDNVRRNLLTVRAEQRFALIVSQPNAFVTGAFTAS